MSIAKCAVNWSLSHSYFMRSPENSFLQKSIKMVTGLFWSIVLSLSLLTTGVCRKRKFSTQCAHLLRTGFTSFKILFIQGPRPRSLPGISGLEDFRQLVSKQGSYEVIHDKIADVHNSFDTVLKTTLDGRDLYQKEYIGEVVYSLSGTERVSASSLKLKGVALIAAMLSQKHAFLRERLFVCETLSGLQQQIEGKIRSGMSGKFAYVVGATTGPGCHGVDIAPWQHKIAIGLEIHNGKIKIINFESDKVPAQVLKDEFDSIRIYSAELFLSGIRRESVYGCETFALRDAVAFLEDEEFFSKIRRLPEKADGFAKVVLPPRFMIGTQSIDRICAYIAENPDLSKEMFVHRRKAALLTPQNLFDRILENSIKGLRGKLQNHYTSYRSFKYHNYVLQLLRTESKKNLERMIGPIYCA